MPCRTMALRTAAVALAALAGAACSDSGGSPPYPLDDTLRLNQDG